MPRKKKIITEKKKPAAVSPKIPESKKYILATGRRKTATAQIKFNPSGSGEIIINEKELKKYFPYETWQKIVCLPIELTHSKNYEIKVKVKGGGLQAQAESIRLGISRALVQLNPDLRKIFKPKGLLSRDARKKERKKPGLKRARRAPQWQKR